MQRILFAILLLSVISTAQTAPPPPSTLNTITVSADGKFEAEPDTAVIDFSFSVQENQARAAYDHLSRAVEQLRDLFRQNGIDPKQAQVGYFSVQPVRDYRNPKQKIIAYTASTDVTLKLKDFSKLPSIVESFPDVEVSCNESISYVLDNIDAAKIKASEDALHRAKAEAEAVATASGRTLGELVYASVDTIEQPRPMPMYARAMNTLAQAAVPEPTAEFSAQKITVTAHLNAMFALR
jgi:hypothetical protein